jgi:hypothetical protein
MRSLPVALALYISAFLQGSLMIANVHSAFVAPSLCVQHAPDLTSAATKVACGSGGAVVVRRAVQPLRWPARLPRDDLDVAGIQIDVTTGVIHLSPEDMRRLPVVALRALSDLALAHAQATSARQVVGRVAILRGTRCPRLHVDKVNLRTVCTLFGPGTVVAPREAVDMNALLRLYSTVDGTLTVEDHDSLLLKDTQNLVELEAGDTAFLVGAGRELDELDFSVACIHRSPRLSAYRRRLIVQIDDAIPKKAEV